MLKNMGQKSVEDILRKLAKGQITISKAKKLLAAFNVKQVGDFARLDVGRLQRLGIPEAILAQGKAPAEVARAGIEMARECGYALITRVEEKHLRALKRALPKSFRLDFRPKARAVVLKRRGFKFSNVGKVGILAAGTADIPVAEEAAVAAEVMGCRVLKAYDVGVAGIHRLFEPLKHMLEERVAAIIAVAGMEGTLPSLVSSLVDVPVIGVPTSVAYGVGVGGVGALMTMLQTCTPKLAVVNIDNGFGAGIFAALIAKQSRGG